MSTPYHSIMWCTVWISGSMIRIWHVVRYRCGAIQYCICTVLRISPDLTVPDPQCSTPSPDPNRRVPDLCCTSPDFTSPCRILTAPHRTSPDPNCRAPDLCCISPDFSLDPQCSTLDLAISHHTSPDLYYISLDVHHTYHTVWWTAVWIQFKCGGMILVW